MMQSRAARVAVAIGVIAAAVVLFVVLNSEGDDDEAPAPQTRQATRTEPRNKTTTKPRARTETVTVRGGRAVGGVERLEYANGERVRLVIRSDVTDEVHVHGYDLTEEVAAGGSARFDFRATIEGIFEIELEGRKEQIAKLVVRPS
jgi:hypothetical protein